MYIQCIIILRDHLLFKSEKVGRLRMDIQQFHSRLVWEPSYD